VFSWGELVGLRLSSLSLLLILDLLKNDKNECLRSTIVRFGMVVKFKNQIFRWWTEFWMFFCTVLDRIWTGASVTVLSQS